VKHVRGEDANDRGKLMSSFEKGKRVKSEKNPLNQGEPLRG